MKTIAEYSSDVELAIRSLGLPGGKLSSLYEPIEYGLSAGGKRIRPVLVLMGADAFGGNASSAMTPAVGIETFHNFTLLHDDVMDNSDLRRGRRRCIRNMMRTRLSFRRHDADSCHEICGNGG